MGPKSFYIWGPWMYFIEDMHHGVYVSSSALFLLGSDRALYECIFIYTYGAMVWPLCSEDWLPSLGTTFSTTFIYSLLEEISERAIKYGLLYGISFAAFGANALLSPINPSPRVLTPLFGAKINFVCWKSDLINQCQKRTRKRRQIKVPPTLIKQRMHSDYGSDYKVMTKPWKLQFPNEMVSDLVQSLDILEMHHLLDMFNVHRLPLPSNAQKELDRFKSLFDALDTLTPTLSPLDRVLYNSIIPETIMESTFLSGSRADSMPIVVDTGASRSLSPHRSDFESLRPINLQIGTINAASKVEGVGMVRWEITDQDGAKSVIRTEAYYVPSASIRLYSPQFHFREHCEGRLIANAVGIQLELPARKDNHRLSFPYNGCNNLPLMLLSTHPHFKSALFSACKSGADIFAATHRLNPILRDIPVVEYFDFHLSSDDAKGFFNGDHRSTLSSAQRELRLLHNKMGHIHMRRLQKLTHHDAPLDSPNTDEELTIPVVFRSRFAKTRSCSIPLCRSCALGKMRKVKTNTQDISNVPAKEMALQREHLSPGDCVSWDQYVVPHRGRLYSSAGKERECMRFGGGSLAVDHASKKVFIHHQVSLQASDTLVAKRLLERNARAVGISISRYHADNGVFASEEFKADCELKNQRLTFSASNSHHQNGVAERYIGTISRMARSMLIHSALLWPRSHDVKLWPMAMDYAVFLWNNLPMDDGMSPEEKWTKTKFQNYNHLRKAHVFGCPCYVLNPKLVEGQKIPKWDPRSRQGKFVGYSKNHATSAGLILNRRTGYISPQFHVLYDDSFESVPGCDENQNQSLLEVDWPRIIDRQGGSEINYDLEDIQEVPDHLHDSWLTEEERHAKHLQLNRHARQPIQQAPVAIPNQFQQPIIVVNPGPRNQVNPPVAAAPNNDDRPNQANVPNLDEAREGADNRLRRSTRRRQQRNQLNYDRLGGPNNRANYANGSACSRSGCFTTHAEAVSYQNAPLTRRDLDNHYVQNLEWGDCVAALAAEAKESNGDASRFFATMDALQDPIDLTLDEMPTLSFVSKASTADHPGFDEAMNGPNSKGFWEASLREVETLAGIGTWTQVKRESWMNVIQSTWALRIKRFPDGLVRKLKSRLCVRGDQQVEGVDFFETFAPVVQWSTVRIMFILSLQLGLASMQVDYVSAFCQAPIEEDVYISIPRGWETLNEMGLTEKFKPGHVLKLNRSMYGLRQSPRNFFMFLKENLEKAGLKQSIHDPCLFFSDEVICVCYVDDCLWWSTEQNYIDKVIKKVKENMDLEVEDSVNGFLGISVDHKIGEDGNPEIHLTQKGLIDRVITALGLDSAHSNGVKTPAPDKAPLPQDKDGDPNDLGFNYASVVGMAMYLCNNSRPDIAFAVHQCARHCFKPTRKHAEYLKRIGRYLIHTRDKGLIIKPNKNQNILDIECFVDADFAGLFNHEDSADPHCVRSRTGFVIRMGGSPIIWGSKLQPVIASSTMESEYIALSTACKDLLPIRNIAKEIAKACGITDEERSSMHTTIWEDNVGALTLANLELPLLTPRSKSFAVRYHWFRQFVSRDNGEDGGIVIKKVDTKSQIADIFTKGLGRQLFESLRHMLMGW